MISVDFSRFRRVPLISVDFRRFFSILSITSFLISDSSRPTTQENRTPPPPRERDPQSETEWREFTIPPLWKRLVAEIIDFFILFILKLVITFVAVDWFSLVDLDRYDMSFWTAAAGGTADLDLQAAQDLFDFTSDFVLLEMIHRLVVCVFEALCLHRGFGRYPGGATPGKLIMGLRVVSCFQVSLEFFGFLTAFSVSDAVLGSTIISDFAYFETRHQVTLQLVK